VKQLTDTIPAVLANAASQYGDALAIDDVSGNWSYSQLHVAAVGVSKALLANGIHHGDRIAIWSPNLPQWIIACLGLQSIGAVLVPLSPRFQGSEAGDILCRSGVKALFYYPQLEQGAVTDLLAEQDLPQLTLRIAMQVEGSSTIDATSWEQFLLTGAGYSDEQLRQAQQAVNADDVADILFTSGTTGKPKGVICSQQQNIRVFSEWVNTVGLRSDDIYLGINPFFHSFGYKAGWLASILAGSTIVPMRSFDKDELLSVIQEKRISMWPGAPSIYAMILAHPARKNYDLSSLRLGVTGAASVPVTLVEAMRDDLGFEVVVTAYGLTESCGVVSICRQDDPPEIVATTSGKAIAGVEVKCVDPATEQEVDRGLEGEIWVRGYNVMKGYLDMPAASQQAITAEGWLRTGDIGVMDSNDYLRITDRLKDMYIMNGENVYPAEVEHTIFALEQVAQVAVVGISKSPQGEVGIAFVVARSDIGEQSVISHCQQNLASYKVPFKVIFVAALPLNAAGKVLKNTLREQAVIHQQGENSGC
jgi:acyl-CoA synthetase (AMP-forming)/AMP-acid ligase II